MDGTRGNRSDITIDGVASTATANANEVISSYVPPQDLVAEFKVQTATFDAATGNTEGGVTNLSIKAGTNNFHGTAYWTKLAPNLFANDFFANANKIARRNGSIIAYAADHKTEVGRWNFEKAWPVRWEMSEFDTQSGQAAVETLELAVHRVTKGK